MTAPQRRWFRFSLRTMMLAVAIVGGLTMWTLQNWRDVRARETLLRAYCARGAGLGPMFAAGELIIGKETGRPIPWMWRFLGAENPGGDIWLSPDEFTPSEKARLQALYPDV